MNGYKKPRWAIKQITRETGLIEDICKHGVGHPNIEWLKLHDPEGKLAFSVHGCDGCCSKKRMRREILRNKPKPDRK